MNVIHSNNGFRKSQDETIATEFMVIQEAAHLLGETLDADSAINKVLRLLSQMLGLNRGRVFLFDKQSRELHLEYAYGLTQDEIKRGIYQSNEGVTGRAFAQKQVAVIENIDNDPLYQCRSVDRQTLPAEMVSYIAVPILQNDRTPIGVLGCNRLRNRARAFQRDIDFLKVIATLISQTLHLRKLVAEHNRHLHVDRQGNPPLQGHNTYGIIGSSPALRLAIKQALNFVDAPIPVLLNGESGTGKEKFANMLHVASERKAGPFIAINCSAIPENLLEAELFGYEKGAFTGAAQAKPGKFELANGGTLFLDEIADLDYDMQPKLLRVLEEKVINRIGSVKDIPVNIRLIAASHKNLQHLVNEGKFRIDLFYRLNVLPIELPPLRQRNGDIALLVQHFLNKANQDFKRETILATGVIQLMEGFHWPGNIRQLENVIKRAVLLADRGVIEYSAMETILLQESRIQSLDTQFQDTQPGDTTPAVTMPGNTTPRDTTPHDTALHNQQAHAPGNARWLPTANSHGGQMGNYRQLDRNGAPPQQPSHEGLVRDYRKADADQMADIVEALRCCNGNKSKAALMLGYTPRQLRYRIEKLKIRY